MYMYEYIVLSELASEAFNWLSQFVDRMPESVFHILLIFAHNQI